jgi:hypothetical protein
MRGRVLSINGSHFLGKRKKKVGQCWIARKCIRNGKTGTDQRLEDVKKLKNAGNLVALMVKLDHLHGRAGYLRVVQLERVPRVLDYQEYLREGAPDGGNLGNAQHAVLLLGEDLLGHLLRHDVLLEGQFLATLLDRGRVGEIGRVLDGPKESEHLKIQCLGLRI